MFYRVDGRPTLLIWLILALLVSGAALAFSYPRLYEILKLHVQSPIATDENKATAAAETAPVIVKETEKSEPNEEKKGQKNQRTAKGPQHSQKKSKNVEINKLKIIP